MRKKANKARYFPVAAVLALSLALGMQVQAGILLDDTFADGSRSETSLPTESAVWISHPGSVTMGTGSLAYTQSGSSQKLWTYFAGDGAPVTLNVGEQLVATVDFTPRVALYDNSSKSFRFGLFNDPTDGQLQTDTNSDSGGGLWTDSTGYGVQLALSLGTTTSANASVGKRTDQTNTSLMGSGGAWTLTSGGNPIVNTLDTLYTLTLSLDRLAVDQMQVSFAISDSGGVISTHTILDDPNGAAAFGTNSIATSFDQLFFRFSNNTTTADVIDISRIKVEVIPEPATLSFLGLSGLVLFMARRRLRR